MIHKNLSILIFSLFTCCISYAQPLQKAASDAYVITRMAQKFHVQPRPLDKTFSNDLFNGLLKQLDEDRVFFTAEDIARLQPYQWQMAEQIQQQKTDFLQLLVSLYKQRLLQADTIIEAIATSAFNFSLPEKFTVAEDTSYPVNAIARRSKLYKSIKLTVLNAIQENMPDTFAALPAARQKKITDSLEIVYRKKAKNLFKRSIQRMLLNPGGIEQSVADTYCEAIASCYDPHSAYLPPLAKENFETELGKHAFRFGFALGQDANDHVTIDHLQPGSPAYKSGLLNEGDKIQSIQWEAQPPVDVSDAGKQEVDQLLSLSNHDKITLTIKKADGSSRQVPLKKEMDESGDDDNKVKSFLLKGTKTIGYISLPAFYTDWEDEEKDINGCANDVAKELVKLKKEKIDGLVLDLRYNGGGSVREAVELAGIFIDAGPVAQQKSNEAKVYTLKDVNRGTIYDGPLLLLVNGYSASASEMLAGTLQDYNRALIAGTPSFGKATAQVVLPLDTTITPETNIQNKQAAGYVKLTVEKLYRINGSSAQGKGVVPDILLPDVLEADPHREANEPFSLVVAPIEANKYYKPYSPFNMSSLTALAAKEVAADAYFKAVSDYVLQYKAAMVKKDLSLQWLAALQQNKSFPDIDEVVHKKMTGTPPFSIENNLFEQQRLQADKSLKEANDEMKKYLSYDHYIRIAYNLLCSVAK